MTAREELMIREINYVRTRPAEYAEFIKDFLEDSYFLDDDNPAARELYQQLKAMKPVPPLKFSPFLYGHAVKHGQWMKITGQFEHSKFTFPYGENLVAETEDVRFALLDLLVDDGIPSRGHRINILDPEYKYIAVYEVPGKVGDDEFVFIQQFSYGN